MDIPILAIPKSPVEVLIAYFKRTRFQDSKKKNTYFSLCTVHSINTISHVHTYYISLLLYSQTFQMKCDTGCHAAIHVKQPLKQATPFPPEGHIYTTLLTPCDSSINSSACLFPGAHGEALMAVCSPSKGNMFAILTSCDNLK